MPSNSIKLGASVPKTKVAGGFQTTTATYKTVTAEFALTVTTKQEHRVDSRLMARELGVQHHSLFGLLKNYREDFGGLGILRFQTEAINGRGQPEKFALLNEDQAYLLLTYARNTKRVCSLKVKLIQAFRDVRHATELRQNEYLPEYHAMHSQVTELARGSQHLHGANFDALDTATDDAYRAHLDSFARTNTALNLLAQFKAAHLASQQLIALALLGEGGTA
jgi:phage regulator Rha-like protein